MVVVNPAETHDKTKLVVVAPAQLLAGRPREVNRHRRRRIGAFCFFNFVGGARVLSVVRPLLAATPRGSISALRRTEDR